MFDAASVPTDPSRFAPWAGALLSAFEESQALLRERDEARVRDAQTIQHQAVTIESLKFELARLKRWRFGASSERLSAEQLSLWPELLAQDSAAVEEQHRAAQEAPASPRPRPPRPGRHPLPEGLPRIEIRHEAASCTCAACGGPLDTVGEEVSEQLDFIPARFQVLRHRRPKLACRHCETLESPPLPAQVIDRGLPTAGLLAQVLTAKYLDHLPLYRQSGIYARAGVVLARSTLCGWVGLSEVWLEPLAERLKAHLLAGRLLHADETPVPVLAPGTGRTATGYLWAYHSQADALHPIVVFEYAPDRKGCHPQAFLGPWSGTLQVDGYAGYEALFRAGRITEAGCWSHVRRKFFDVNATAPSPVAQQALATIAKLYAIEAELKADPPDAKARARRQRAGPILEALQTWLERVRGQVAPKSELAKAVQYALNRWPALVRYLDDGCQAICNNAVERSIRGIAVGRRNWLFAGSDAGGRRAALVYSLLETCKLNGVEPYAWLRAVLERIPTWPASRIDELLPFHWQSGEPA